MYCNLTNIVVPYNMLIMFERERERLHHPRNIDPKTEPREYFKYLLKESSKLSRKANKYRKWGQEYDAQDYFYASAYAGSLALKTVFSNEEFKVNTKTNRIFNKLSRRDNDQLLLIGTLRRTIRSISEIKSATSVEYLFNELDMIAVNNNEARDLLTGLLSNRRRQKAVHKFIRETKVAPNKQLTSDKKTSDSEEVLGEVISEGLHISTDVLYSAASSNPSGFADSLTGTCEGCDSGGCDFNF